MTSFYVINSPLVNYFFYNFTTTAGGPNLPLDGGLIFFFADEDHSLMLPTYSDVSDPNNPVVNTNPIELNVVGACPIFYLEDRAYYIVITDKNGELDNPIWTIEHYNPSGSAGNADFSTLNYSPNGQFLLHNNLPAEGEFSVGEIREAITPLAYGGYTFEIDQPTTSVNKVTFERYDEWLENPPSNPQFSVRIQCTEPDTGDSKKDWALTFPDVNRFASSTQQYTFGIVGIDNFGGSLPLDLILIKNFGTGGDTQTETILTTFILDSVYKSFYFAFVFGTNEGKIIGADGDDYVKLVLRAPVNEASDFNLTNEQLRPGTLVNPVYPETTQRQDVSAALGGAFPLPYDDGSDLGLYPVRTKDGWRYDDSSIGSTLETFVPSADAPSGYLKADGLESYPYSERSEEGIPYRRIGDKFWIEASGIFAYGSGPGFVTMQEVASAPQNLTLCVNAPGAVTAPADGAIPTGFTFTNVHTGADYGMAAYYSEAWLIVRMNVRGTFGLPSNGDSGFSTVSFRNLLSVNGLVLINGIPVPAGLAGKYYKIDNPATAFYHWFQVNGVGSDPAPGGTAILTNLQSTYSAIEDSQHIAASLSGQQLTNILFLAGSAVPTGSWWGFSAGGNDFYVWYEKDGLGTDPAPAGRKGIKVSISASDTNLDVASLTLFSINKTYLAMPDARGKFRRVWDNGAGWDNPNEFRFNSFGLISGDVVGSQEIDTFLSHAHPFSYDHTNSSGLLAANGSDETLYSTPVTTDSATGFNGDEETRPVNINVNVFIKY